MHPEFEKNGFLHARNFLDSITVNIMSTYLDLYYRYITFTDENKEAFRKTVLGDETGPLGKKGDVSSSYAFYGSLITESILLNYGQKASTLLGNNLLPTYSFTRIYEKGAPLIPHVDRHQCEISATLPVITCNDKPSVIYVANYHWSKISKRPVEKYSVEDIMKKGDYSRFELYPGDALFYRGSERYHWREDLEQDYLAQFFLHYVQADGKHKDLYFDTRPYLGFPDTYVNYPKQ